MKETEEIMGMIKEEGAAYFARERGNKVEVGLYLEHIIEERGMKKKDIVRKLNLEESYARKLFGGQRIPTRKILLQCAFLLSLDLSDTQRLLDIGQKPKQRIRQKSGHPGKKYQILVRTKRRKWTDLHQKNQRHRQTQQVLNR